MNIGDRRLQVVHVVEDFRSTTNSPLHDLDEVIDHEHKKQWREGISLDHSVLKSVFSDFHLCDIGQADLQACHHLDDEHLDSRWESKHLEELLQEGVVDVVICLLEVVVELNVIVLVLPLQHIRGQILGHCLLATLRGSDAPLFQFEDASFTVAKEKLPHPLVDAERQIFVFVGRQVIGR